MPVVAIAIDDLNERLGTVLSTEEMEQYLDQLGCDIEEFTRLRRLRCLKCKNLQELTAHEEQPTRCPECDAEDQGKLWEEAGEVDVVRMDLLPVRPDIFDPGGLSRALRGLLQQEAALRPYQLKPPQLTITLDPIVREESSYRPFVECAVIRGLRLDEVSLRVLMKLQENLHWALGRDRKLASIGVYDLSTIGESIRYTAVGREEITFVPLQSPDGKAQTPEEILTTHPKGTAYAHLLQNHQRVPLLIDQKEQVLSMPPIINSEETRLTLESTEVFIDVTGLEQRFVTKALHTLVTSMLELFPEAKAEAVELIEPEGKRLTPSLETETFVVSVTSASRLLGIPLDTEQVIELFRQMRHDAVPAEEAPETVQVTVPCYRNDIMHEVDLIEDLAIAYNYQNIPRTLVPTMTVAKERPERLLANQARAAMTGLGYFEVMSLMLSNVEEQYELLGLEDPQEAVLVAHPASVEQTLLRTSLLPQLLKLFALNRGQGLPQKLFEVDDVVRLAQGEEEPREELHLVAGLLDTDVGFAEIKALANALAHELQLEVSFQATEHPAFIPGRVASIGWQKQTLGLAGEIHPAVLERLRLTQPLVALELNLQWLLV